MGGGALAGAEPDEKIIDDHLAVQAIIRSYQVMCVMIHMQFRICNAINNFII